MSVEDEIKAECRLYAVEWAISLLFASHFRQAGAAGHVLSAELESAVDRLLGMAKEFLAKGSSGSG